MRRMNTIYLKDHVALVQWANDRKLKQEDIVAIKVASTGTTYVFVLFFYEDIPE